MRLLVEAENLLDKLMDSYGKGSRDQRKIMLLRQRLHLCPSSVSKVAVNCCHRVTMTIQIPKCQIAKLFLHQKNIQRRPEEGVALVLL